MYVDKNGTVENLLKEARKEVTFTVSLKIKAYCTQICDLFD